MLVLCGIQGFFNKNDKKLDKWRQKTIKIMLLSDVLRIVEKVMTVALLFVSGMFWEGVPELSEG